LNRRTTQRVDFDTGRVYSKEEIEFRADPDKPEDEDEDKEEPDDEVIHIGEPTLFLPSKPVKMKQLPSEILDRLVYQFTDWPESANADIQKWDEFNSRYLAELHSIINDANSHISWISLNAKQTPNSVFTDLYKQLSLFGYNNVNVHLPRIIDVHDLADNHNDLSLSTLRSMNVADGEPIRHFSAWGTYDPVHHYKEKDLVNGLSKYITVYKSNVYVFINAENQKEFTDFPDKYLNRTPGLFGIKVGIQGQDPDNVVENLSKMYNMTVFDIDSYIDEINTKGAAHSMYSIVFESLKTGKPLSNEVYAELLVNYATDNNKCLKKV
jgi:YHS domain-containing protein